MRASTQETRSGLGIAIATFIAILTTLSVNVLSNFFPPQGLNIGEIATTILQGVQITPASYAFAIWGLIYLGLIAYGIYQLFPSQRSQILIRQVDIRLIVACLAQIIWVYVFTMQLFWLSVAAMLAILLALIAAYLKLDPGNLPVTRERRWLVYMPFSVYLGWISVATIVNIASALYSSGWQGWGLSDATWTVIMLIVGTVVAGRVAYQRRDVAFTLVFVWAYGAIAVRQFAEPAIWVTAGGAAMILIAIMGLRRLTQDRRQSPL